MKRTSLFTHSVPRNTIAVLLLVVLLVVSSYAYADTAESTAAQTQLAAPETYAGWVLLPALLAIVCAVASRQVIPSLFLGVLVAGYMLVRLDPTNSPLSLTTVSATITTCVETYIIGAIADSDRVKIIVFTLTIGGMVGVVGASGGTQAMVDMVAARASNKRRGQVAAWVAGLIVFFDDYANTMIVGPTMQPVCDRLRISRAKLAYIVDSTAAPVASIALVGTWVGTELAYIAEGLKDVAASGTPVFLEGIDPWNAFLNSIPHRYYAILAVVLVALVAASGRDFRAMARHERDAADQSSAGEKSVSASAKAVRGRWLLSALPIAALVTVTGLVLLYPGCQLAVAAGRAGQPWSLKTLFEGADSYNAILYGALAGVVLAIALAVASRQLTFKNSMEAMTDGMSRMFPAVVVLILAWALSTAAQDLHVGEVVSGWLCDQGFSIKWLPLAVFVSAAGVSFATGTSWGTMGILCPTVVRIAADLGETVPAAEALPLFYGSVGSVLAGAIFGDHCSPISDTTVLSSIASGCTLEVHVWTQLPYAACAALVSMMCGNVLCGYLGFSPWLGLACGCVLLLSIVRFVGTRSVKPAN